MKIINKSEAILANQTRRSFLKLLALGGGVVVAGSVLSTLKVKSNPFSFKNEKTNDFLSKFNVFENTNELSIRTKSGDEILIIEKSV